MSQNLDAILSDVRLDRICGAHDKSCVIQLWLLQLNWGSKTETRVLYGRVLPSSFRNDQWNAPHKDAFKSIDDALKAQVVRLNLFCGAKLAKAVIELLADGSTLEALNNKLGLKWSPQFNARFGSACLDAALGFRPPMHMPARDYFRWATNRLSPTASTSADSAAITSLAKSELFVIGNQTEPGLAVFATDELSEDTGLDFSGLDAWRLGDVELIVLPSLDDKERQLVNVTSDGAVLHIEILAALDEQPSDFRIRVQFLNDNSIFHTDTASLPLGTAFPATVAISIPPTGRDMVDAYELEIDGNRQGSPTWRPYVRWGVHLVREISQELHFSGGLTTVKNDWLSKALRPAHKSRLEGAQQIARQTRASASVIGDRKADPWVPANRQASRVVSQLVPRKSEGRFFLRYSEGENTGRLELAEWLKKLLAQHRDMHIAWFDPFMEDAGINLLNQYGSDSGNYLVFTGIPEKRRPSDWVDDLYNWVRRRQGLPERQERKPETRIPNLLAACRAWADKVGSVRLRVVGLPADDVHDRMILIRNAHMEPVAGYHLSNSIQLANENHPLLITPIPDDVLQRVVAYADATIRGALENASATSNGPDAFNPILFDSAAHKRVVASIYSRDDIYEMPRSGEVLAWWLGNPGLTSLSGRELKVQLDSQGLLAEGDMRGPHFDEPPQRLWSSGLGLPNFNSAWDAMGVLLASTMAGDNLRQNFASTNTPLSQSLYAYLDSMREDAIQPPPERYGVVNMSEYLNRSLAELMRQMADPQRMFLHDVTEVSWGDYYAIKVLWFTDAPMLVRWIEDGASDEFRNSRRRQLGLKCAVRVISFEIEWGCSKLQLDALLASTNDFLRWMGFAAFEALLQSNSHAVGAISAIPRLGPKEKVQLLGWLIARTDRQNPLLRGALIAEFMASLPPVLPDSDLASALDSLRGPLGRLFESPPWILQDIVAPLIHSDRLSVDQAAVEWIKEAIAVWVEGKKSGGLLFRSDSEGAFTDEVASLLALAGSATQTQLLCSLETELKACGRTIRLPFSAQINWSKHDKALVVSLWIAGLLAETLKCLPRPSVLESKLHQLLAEADELVSRRSRYDWTRTGVSNLLQYREAAVD